MRFCISRKYLLLHMRHGVACTSLTQQASQWCTSRLALRTLGAPPQSDCVDHMNQKNQDISSNNSNKYSATGSDSTHSHTVQKEYNVINKTLFEGYFKDITTPLLMNGTQSDTHSIASPLGIPNTNINMHSNMRNTNIIILLDVANVALSGEFRHYERALPSSSVSHDINHYHVISELFSNIPVSLFALDEDLMTSDTSLRAAATDDDVSYTAQLQNTHDKSSSYTQKQETIRTFARLSSMHPLSKHYHFRIANGAEAGDFFGCVLINSVIRKYMAIVSLAESSRNNTPADYIHPPPPPFFILLSRDGLQRRALDRLLCTRMARRDRCMKNSNSGPPAAYGYTYSVSSSPLDVHAAFQKALHFYEQ